MTYLIRLIFTFPAIIKFSIAEVFAWRGQAITWVLFDPLLLIAFPFLWVRIAQDQGGTIAGWDVSTIATYYMIYAIGMQVIMSHPMVYVSNQIERGRLAQDLLRPYPYFMTIFVSELSWKVVRAILTLLPIAIMFLAFHRYFMVPELSALLVAVPLLLMGFFIEFLASFLIGIFTFWTEHPLGLHSLFWIISGIGGGMYAPVEFLPHWMSQIVLILPFWGVLQFPINVIMGRIEIFGGEFFQGITHQIIWLIALAFAFVFVWRRGTRRYVSSGQ